MHFRIRRHKTLRKREQEAAAFHVGPVGVGLIRVAEHMNVFDEREII